MASARAAPGDRFGKAAWRRHLSCEETLLPRVEEGAAGKRCRVEAGKRDLAGLDRLAGVDPDAAPDVGLLRSSQRLRPAMMSSAQRCRIVEVA